VIVDENEESAEQGREILAEHLRRCPQDRAKQVQWIRRIIVNPPPIDPARIWRGIQAEPEAAATRETELEPDRPEPKTYVWISVRHAHPEGEHGGEIREGFYDCFDGKVIVTTPRAGRSAVRRTTVIRLLWRAIYCARLMKRSAHFAALISGRLCEGWGR
jgi:hypothetical protein